jgi:hypothetical protein
VSTTAADRSASQAAQLSRPGATRGLVARTVSKAGAVPDEDAVGAGPGDPATDDGAETTWYGAWLQSIRPNCGLTAICRALAAWHWACSSLALAAA